MWLPQEPAIAQQAREKLEEQKSAMAGFYLRFTHPLDVCAIAESTMLAKARTLVSAVREKHSRAFEVVEGHPVYLATVYAARRSNDEHYRTFGKPAALRACLEGISMLENPDAQKQYDSYMQYLLALLLTST